VGRVGKYSKTIKKCAPKYEIVRKAKYFFGRILSRFYCTSIVGAAPKALYMTLITIITFYLVNILTTKSIDESFKKFLFDSVFVLHQKN